MLVAFIVLKVAGVIAWSWWLVLLPLWIIIGWCVFWFGLAFWAHRY